MAHRIASFRIVSYRLFLVLYRVYRVFNFLYLCVVVPIGAGGKEFEHVILSQLENGLRVS